jgi:CRP/FNR family transcriptional regulator, anaerobic regulatory protein
MYMPVTFKAETSQSLQPCASCALQTHCFTQYLEDEVLSTLGQIMTRRPVARGTVAYRLADPFKSLFFIHAGFFKTVAPNEEGQEFIVGFPMTGDVMGLDGCADGRYSSQAMALEDSVVCEIPFEALETLSQTFPVLQQSLHRIMSREIIRNQKSMLLGSLAAEQRLLAFLHELSQQFAARGISANAFDLPMTREDIAGFLGLKMETVSRAFTKLHAEGLINVHRRHVRIDTARAA